jgi:hypothetical protein
MKQARTIAWSIVVMCIAVLLFPGLGDIFPGGSGLSRLARDPLTPLYALLALASAAYLSFPKWHTPVRLRIFANICMFLGVALLLLVSFVVGFGFIFAGRALATDAAAKVVA